MGQKTPDDVAAELARRLGPDVARFAEYASGEMWGRVRAHAAAMGLNPAEAEGVAVLVVRAAVVTMARSVQQAKRERLFRKAN